MPLPPDLLSMISGDPAADPWLTTGLGLMGSAYNIRAPFSGALTGLQAASKARTRGIAGANVAHQMMQRQQRMDALQMITDPQMRAYATMGMQPPQPYRGTSLMQNAIAAGLTPGTPEFQQFVREGTLKPQTQTQVNVGTGSIPTGFIRQETTEGTRLVPETGSEVDVKRRQGLAALEGMLADVQELERLVIQYGTENPYSEAGQRMQTIRNRIIGNMPTFRETGVLQEGEIARLEKEFPDPTGWVTPGGQVLPKVRGFREEIARKLADKRQAFGYAEPPTGVTVPTAPPRQQGGWAIIKRGQ